MATSDITSHTPLRAIIWCAVSSPAQAGKRRKRASDDDEVTDKKSASGEDEKTDKISLDMQESSGREVCEKFGWSVVDVLRMAHSRDYRNLDVLANACRTKGIYEPDRLISHCNAKDFDVFVCWDGDRIGRTSALINDTAHFIIRDTGATIYSVNDKYMVESEDDFWVLLTGVRARHENKKRVEQWRAGTANRVKNGLPLTSKAPVSHELIRNTNGQAVKLELNVNLRRLWDDLATLLLEGVGWRDIENLIYTRYAHVDPNGNPYRWTTLQKLLYNPLFWGHSAQNHTNKKVNGYVTGLWVFDEGEEVPQGVIVHRNTVPAVYTGEQAERVKAELRRRTLIIKGRANPQETNQFTGLFVCGECGHALTSHTRKYNPKHQRGLRCMTAARKLGTPCSQKKMTPYRYVREWLDNALRQWLDGVAPEEFTSSYTDIDEKAKQIEQVQQEKSALEKRIGNMIMDQSIAPESAQNYYRKTIAALSESDAMLQNRLLELQREVKQAESSTSDQTAALSDLRAITLDKFWELPDGDINRLLSRIFGSRQLVVMDKQIVGSAERSRRRYNPHHMRNRTHV